MYKNILTAALCMVLFLAHAQYPAAQEPEDGSGFIIEGDISDDIENESRPSAETEFQAEEPIPEYITADVLTAKDMKPVVNFYIRSDINRKFSGLITNLKLERIYGVLQEGKIATVYFDYSYTSVRNRDNILFEKGKMTFMKFNSGRWFNAELSIFLMDSYPSVRMRKQQEKGE